MERKRLRYNFGSFAEVVAIPSLLDNQKESYKKFLEPYKDNPSGIDQAFKSIFPIESHNGKASIEYLGYKIGESDYDIEECRKHGTSYTAPIHAKLSLIIKEKADKKEKIKKKIEQEVYMGDVHKMTPIGSFIVNGTERAVVSQLHRSPGVFFNHDKGITHVSGKLFYSARIIPYNGSWLDFEFDLKGNVCARIDRRHRLPVNYLLGALDMSNQEILSYFFGKDLFQIKDGKLLLHIASNHIKDEMVGFDIKNSKGELLVAKGRRITDENVEAIAKANIKELPVDEDYLYNKVLAEDITVDGEILVPCNTKLRSENIKTIIDAGIKSFHTIYTNDVNRGAFISDTIKNNPITEGRSNAISEIYKIMRPGDQYNKEEAEKFFNNLFFTNIRYNLSGVGRMKLNKRLGREELSGDMALSKQDILGTIKALIDIRDGISEVDDIDSLENRRVRRVGEMVQNAFRLGLIRIERAVKERLSLPEIDKQTPKDLISAKAVSSAVNEFFMSSQLSQLMDQINPLSEITHKRRVSALGPGGLSRERAGFEVRDVHPSHYGRLCPIETPEGPNIGLINSMAIYSKVNDYGFLVTPYRVVKNGRITDEIVDVSAMDEWEHIIASTNAKINAKNKLVDELVPVRHKNEVLLKPASEVTLIDVSSKQLISVAASLIPFLEHDDANRALMGSNMQRQAVPLIKSDKPLVGTGMEKNVAQDSGCCLKARREGVVELVDAKHIVVRTTDTSDELPVDIYPLTKFYRTNQNTCINQIPAVKLNDFVLAGDVLADGAASDKGELAIGTNLRIGLMCWKGYNFEDSILISERLVANEKLTSMHIVELKCIARSTKLGDEEITADIPNVGVSALSSLDDSGIVRIGAEVRTGDILVGMVTPKSEEQLTPEENLLRAIFGEKASNVKDSSLRVPPGVKGTVIDVQIFTREGVEKDARSKEEDKNFLKEARNHVDTMLGIIRKGTEDQLKEKLLNKQAYEKKGKTRQIIKLTKAHLKDMHLERLFDLSIVDTSGNPLDTYNNLLDRSRESITKRERELNQSYKTQVKKIKEGDKDLPPGIIKMAKVHIAVKRHVQPGDKMAGRHGNKGVVSAIMPVEDMPYDEQGNPLDIVLSPLGLPSRMNIGQLLEAHLGYAAKELGNKIQTLLNKEKEITSLRSLVKNIYKNMDNGAAYEYIDSLDDKQLKDFCKSLSDGVPMASPVFNSASEEDIARLLELADATALEKQNFYDGRTGEPFNQQITSGYMYILKLNHLVEDKIHARSIGSYGLVTQQPLGGKSKMGGQRFGEMEVWALEAYGAAYTLQEMLTVKSDDIEGRKHVYKNIIEGGSKVNAYIPESFNVLIKEIRALGLNIDYQQQ